MFNTTHLRSRERSRSAFVRRTPTFSFKSHPKTKSLARPMLVLVPLVLDINRHVNSTNKNVLSTARPISGRHNRATIPHVLKLGTLVEEMIDISRLTLTIRAKRMNLLIHSPQTKRSRMGIRKPTSKNMPQGMLPVPRFNQLTRKFKTGLLTTLPRRPEIEKESPAEGFSEMMLQKIQVGFARNPKKLAMTADATVVTNMPVQVR